MSAKDAKEWLRAALEGRIGPGDPEWNKIWQEDDLGELRKALHEVGTMAREQTVFDEEGMWRMIERHRHEGRNKPRRAAVWRRAAVAAVVLAVGGAAWLMMRTTGEIPIAQAGAIEAGDPRAYLEMAHGGQIDLAAVADNTVLDHDGVKVRVDASGAVVYEGGEMAATETVYNKISVPRKGEWVLTLADGSKVWLNSESELRFPTFFTEGERRVFLKGEAFFDVAHNAEKPFIVEAEGIDVRVLGTRFNVNAYAPHRAILTTVESGMVQASDRDGNMSGKLTPGRQAVWENGAFTARDADVSAIMAWINGKFNFEGGATLEEIAEQMTRWYDIEFVFASEAVKGFKFAGVIRKAQPANEILSLIEKTTRVDFTIKDGVITASER